MTDDQTTTMHWQPWRVAPDSGFEVADRNGGMGLVQRTSTKFDITTPFRFVDESVEADLARRLEGAGLDRTAAGAAIDDARTFTPAAENPTDLASIPRFMRWFESPYGLHTLAAILHDNLIVKESDGGALRSDTLADRFFREMMRAAGVPWLKRWIMWAAVALRTRWAAGGLRQVSVVVWLVCSCAGIAAFVGAIVDSAGWDAPGPTGVLWAVAVALPFVAGLLWGKQYGASLVAAVTAPWVLPGALLAIVGYLIYGFLECLAEHLLSAE